MNETEEQARDQDRAGELEREGVELKKLAERLLWTLQPADRDDAVLAAWEKFWRRPPRGNGRARAKWRRRVLQTSACDLFARRSPEPLGEGDLLVEDPRSSSVLATLVAREADVEQQAAAEATAKSAAKTAFAATLPKKRMRPLFDLLCVQRTTLEEAAEKLHRQACHVRVCLKAISRRAGDFAEEWISGQSWR